MGPYWPDDPDELEAARKLFAGPCRFLAGATQAEQIPEGGLPEVAFAGRSNVGKSSLINALTGRKTLARTSQTPGCTRQVNFFDLAGRLCLVDLPGYGYARESKSKVAAWTELIFLYLKARVPLRRVCLLIDARHGVKVNDEPVMETLDAAAVPYDVILTKADKTDPTNRAAILAEVRAVLRRHVAAYPEPLLTSAQAGEAIPTLRAYLARQALPHAIEEG